MHSVANQHISTRVHTGQTDTHVPGRTLLLTGEGEGLGR